MPLRRSRIPVKAVEGDAQTPINNKESWKLRGRMAETRAWSTPLASEEA